MDTIYVVLSCDTEGVEAISAFSEELDAQAEIVKLIHRNENTKWYNYVAVDWRG